MHFYAINQSANDVKSAMDNIMQYHVSHQTLEWGNHLFDCGIVAGARSEYF